MKTVFLFLISVLTMSCTPNGFTPEEQALIGSSESGILRVLKTDDPADSLQLRKISQPLDHKALRSDTYSTLKTRMLATVNDPANPGVGIAAPQVGILRQLIAVERHDLDEPIFRFYANPRIERYSDETASGPEGCLSVPNRSETVERSRNITISYLDETTGERKEETIEGFTAVIFQHEIDHLGGILYIDRIDECSAPTNESEIRE